MTYQYFTSFCRTNIYVLIVASIVIQAVQADQTKEDARKTQSVFSWSGDIGVGFDSNIYRAPSNGYTDFSPTVQQLIDPDIQSGFFIPIGVEGVYNQATGKKNNLIANFKVSADLYLDSQYSNADNSSLKIRVGDKYIFQKSKKSKDSVYAGLILSSVKDEYVDRDSGLDKTSSSGRNISNRYSYNAAGFESKYNKIGNSYKFNINLKILDRDYDDPVAVSQYDHTYVSVASNLKFKLSTTSKIKAGLKYYTYDYDERPSRNIIDGRLTTLDPGSGLPSTNPPRNYTYYAYLLSYSYKISAKWRAYADYTFWTREDDYQGYHDYDANKIRVRTKYQYSKNLQMKLAVTFWERDYPNAFAFDRPTTQSALDYDGLIVDYTAKYTVDKNCAYVFELNWRDDNSSDPRYDFERTNLIIGMHWNY